MIQTGDEARRLAEYCSAKLDLGSARLGDEYLYNSVSLCVIDAVYSIGVRYTGTRKVVRRYCEYFDVQESRISRCTLAPVEQQEAIDALLLRYRELGIEGFANLVFANRQRTSSRYGILKSEAVLLFATTLCKHGVAYLQDIPSALSNCGLEGEIRTIPGQRSGISLNYFFMLAGSDDLVKPDRMIMRFLENALGHEVEPDTAGLLVQQAACILAHSHPLLTPRLLDHCIWAYQRKQAITTCGGRCMRQRQGNLGCL